jgi:hypothetical protein
VELIILIITMLILLQCGDQSYGLIKYNSEQVGNITFDIKGANIAPYLGIGFGRSIPKHLVGVGFDMGVFYHGNPQTKLNTTGTLNQVITQKTKPRFKKLLKD